VVSGLIGMVQAFGGDKVEALSELLVKKGFNYSGKDYLTSGMVRIFTFALI
jgi:DNA-directed RNA polymerase III subunit RPC2